MKAANRLLFESFGPVTDAGIRRAISTAYYALFHDVVETATDQFVGRDRRGTAGYAIIYRAFSHTRMKKIFNDIDRDQLSPKYREALGRQSVNLELRKFARFFMHLQEKRHLADYDPNVLFTRREADLLIATAETSLGVFERSSADERIDILALLLVSLLD